jgi:hypothetical protein
MPQEAPFKSISSESVGVSGEHMYWAPAGSINPVCNAISNNFDLIKIFNNTVLAWADRVSPVGIDLYYAAKRNEKDLEKLKHEAYCNDGIPFVSISDTPLDEEYFEENYDICYFASKPQKISDGKYITVGVIGK